VFGCLQQEHTSVVVFLGAAPGGGSVKETGEISIGNTFGEELRSRVNGAGIKVEMGQENQRLRLELSLEMGKESYRLWAG